MKHLRKVSVAPAAHCSDPSNVPGILTEITGADPIGCITELLKIDNLFKASG